MPIKPHKVFLCGKSKHFYKVFTINLGKVDDSLDEQATMVKDKSAKLEAKLEREIKKKMASRVIIKHIFGVDLKKAAKMFANRFACGSSVAKNNQGQDEIVVQGDFSDELYQLILSNWPNVPEENIDKIEEKKKKKSES
ncbi:hypothetical protein RO3G_08748 [Rhizopus delemar RA 99-880]|uniref:Translation machinery-associated protein 22 n=1 Tax=Rhizopus delemar (strain RA 99-880 / ATCC MYA-4621 / FGSC 9543 / NRRL 43880) TaxID=246409 RepID=I1C6G3_RHIO9|nr:hypothetical protein RO3G_08748 [Rhizopus delemar RA 99-880]|eukprot:EIE84043.1 hypothetical protein RO3G_08748 [Rhizopus delemar RA 99-880]